MSNVRVLAACALTIMATGCGKAAPGADAGSGTKICSNLASIPLSEVQADAGNVTGAIQRIEATLFCQTGGTECSDGKTICGAHSSCVTGGTCVCDYGYTAADCSGNTGDNLACANGQWQCAAKPAAAYGPCAVQSQCPANYLCGTNAPCLLGVAQCLPECDPSSGTACPTHTGEPTLWCAPTSNSTEGGFCSGTSGCSVAMQNCPDALLDPMEPGSTQNPVVKYTCEPVGPGLNVCNPAGTIGLGLSCTGTFESACTSLSNQCAFGLTCIGDSSEATCYQQCSDPEGDSGTHTQSPDCPTGKYCATLHSGGNTTADTTGVCAALTG